MFSPSKPLPALPIPRIPPKPAVRRSLSPEKPPVPAHRRDENQNDVQDVPSVSAAISKFEKSKPTVVIPSKPAQKQNSGLGVTKPLPPLPNAALKPTVVKPAVSLAKNEAVRSKAISLAKNETVQKHAIALAKNETVQREAISLAKNETVRANSVSLAKKMFEQNWEKNNPPPPAPTVVKPSPSPIKPVAQIKPQVNHQQNNFNPTIVHQSSSIRRNIGDSGNSSMKVKALAGELQGRLNLSNRPPAPSVASTEPLTVQTLDYPTNSHVPSGPSRPDTVNLRPASTRQRSASPRKSGPPRPPPPKLSPTQSSPHGIAQVDFSGELYDEITCKVGDIILLTKDLDAEWFCGYNPRLDKHGMIPKSFVSVVIPLSSSSSASSQLRRPASFGDFSQANNSMQQNTIRNGPRARALHEYNSGVSEDLSFTPGEMLRLTRRLGEEWLEGESQDGRRRGMFPRVMVEVIEDLPVESETSHPYNSQPDQSACRGHVHMGGSVVKALHDYSKSTTEDLPFRAGDSITVTGKINDDWLCGYLETNPSFTGMFPASFVGGIPTGVPVVEFPPSASSSSQQASPQSGSVSLYNAADSENIYENQQEMNSLVGRIAVALYDYPSQDSRDLYFFAGDRIEIKGDEGEWLRGRIEGSPKTLPDGLFPASFQSGSQAQNVILHLLVLYILSYWLCATAIQPFVHDVNKYMCLTAAYCCI